MLAIALPLSMMPHVHLEMSHKIAVVALFALALLVVAFDIYRFVLVLTDPNSMNNILVWNFVKCAVVIFLANAPVLRPLLFKEDFMRGGSMRGIEFIEKVMRGNHKRARSTTWSTPIRVEVRQYGRNRLSGKSFTTYNIEEGEI